MPEFLHLQINEIVAETYGRVSYRVLSHTDVLWSEGEGDQAVALIELSGGRRELLTIGGTRNLTRSDLAERVEAYRTALAETSELLRILDGAAS